MSHPPIVCDVAPAMNSPVVLVTGGAKRLGREIALTLARAGWRVAVHYRGSQQDAIDTVASCALLTGPSGHFQADLGDETAVRALVPQVVAQMGRLDAVVNNAAAFAHDDATSFSYAALDLHLRANAGAPILLAQALHAHLVQRAARGVVVNLLDQKLWNLNPDFLSYTLSKVALESANTVLATALAPQLRVVGVAPGLTLNNPLLSGEQFQAMHAQGPLGRGSSPDEVAAAVLFALTNPAITGTTLMVDGGQHLMKSARDFAFMQPQPE
jgi:NAD(P)-dependent dehydrogenase (short-subunit alcohol dehydrogenase family)